MHRSSLLMTSAILLSALVISASLDHRGYLELCVCVVNALSRAVIALSISLVLGATQFALQLFHLNDITLHKTIGVMQWAAFSVSFFFLIQYVLFLLEVV